MSVFARTFFRSTLAVLGGFLCVLAFQVSTTIAAPQINNQINYQARLMDASGFPVADGNYSVFLSLYDASTGGNRLWTATGTLATPTALTVNVQNGLFTVLLGDTATTGGSQNTLDTVNWNSDQIFLGVTINADSEMAPRKRFASAPQAFNARQLQGMYASSTASGGQTLFTINQTEANAATGTRTALDVRTNGTSNANDFLIRGLDGANATVFSVNRQGNATTSFLNASSIFASMVTSTNLQVNIASFATATIAGQGVCLSDGSFCASGSFTEADTLQTISNRGAFTTTTLTLFGGLAASNITATGTLTVTGSSSFAGITFTNGTGTNATTTNFFTTNLFATNLLATTGTITALNFTNSTGSTLNLLTLSANTVTSTAVFVNGQPVCLANGTNCSTAFLDTLQSVTARGNFTTTTVELFGGFVAASSTVTSTFTALGNITLGNDTGDAITVGGRFSSDLVPTTDLANSLGIASNRWNGYFGNVTATNVTTTNLYASGLLGFGSASGSALSLLNPLNPTSASLTDTTGTAFDVVVSNGYAYVADGTEGLQIFDVANTLIPRFVTGTSLGNADEAWEVFVAGKYAYVAYSDSGLRIYDISDPSSPTNVGFISGSVCRALGVYVSGKYAYAGCDSSGFKVIDVSDPTSPRVVATVSTTAGAGVFVQGRYAYMADGSAGLRIIDISNPHAPTLQSTVNLADNALYVSVSGRYAYVTADSVLAVVDVASSTNASQIATASLPTTGWGVDVSGNFAYVGNFASGLSIINISNPYSPTLISSFDGGANLARGVFVAGKFAYVAESTGGLRIVDLQGADISTARIGDLQAGSASILVDLEVGNNIFARNSLNVGRGGLFSDGGVFSATNTTSSLANLLVGTSTYSGELNALFRINGNDLFVGGNIGSASSIYTNGAFVAGGASTYFGNGFISKDDAGMLTISAVSGTRIANEVVQTWSSDITPRQLGFLSTSSATPVYQEVRGNYSYVMTDDGFLSILDVTNPNAPRLISTFDSGVGTPKGLDVQSHYVYMLGASDLAVVDVSDPSAPTTTGPLTATGQNNSLDVDGRFIYVSIKNNLQIYQQEAPGNGIGTAVTLGLTGISQIRARNGFVYATIPNGTGIGVIDARDPSAPVLVDTLATGGGETALEVVGSYLYVVTSTLGIIDITNPSSLTPAGQVNGFTAPSFISVVGRYAYITDGSTVAVVDIRSTSTASIVKTISGFLFDPGRLQVVGQYAYVTLTTAAGGLQILNLGGQETYALTAHSLSAGTFDVLEDANIGQGLRVNGQLSVGLAGIVSEGPIVSYSSTTISAIAGSLTVNGQNVCLADGTNCTINAVSATGPTYAVASSVQMSLSNPIDMDVEGDYMYVADNGAQSFVIFDVTDPYNAIELSNTTISLSSNPNAIVVKDNYAYITLASPSSTLDIYDVSTPASPVHISTHGFGTTNATDLVVSNGFAYVLNSTNKLSIVNVSDPANPVTVATSTFGTDLTNIFVVGRYAYVTDFSTNQMYIVDVASSTGPIIVGTASTGGQPQHLFVSNGYAYVANSQFGANTISIIDITSSTAPFTAATTTAGTGAGAVAVAGQYAYVTNAHAGAHVMTVLDVADPTRPEFVTTTEIGLSANNIVVSGQYAYIANFSFQQTVTIVHAEGVNTSDLVSNHARFGNLQVRGDGDDWSAYISTLNVGSNENATGSLNYAMHIAYASTSYSGGLCIDDTSDGQTCPTNFSASIKADGAIMSNAFDLAEMYSVTGTTEAGDVLILDASSTATVMRSSGVAYDSKVIGIVSTDPGFVLGWNSGAKVALTGRVPTKVSMNNGSINVGDALVSADVAGYAMKATQPGMILGYALESVSATGTAEVFVSVGFWAGLAFGPTGQIQVDDNGNVSIMNDLHVGGRFFPSLKGGGIQNDWYLFVNADDPTSTYISTNAAGFMSMDTYDFAERYYSPDELEPGDLVIVSDTGRTHVQRSLNTEQMLLGIVSTRPAFIAGRPATSTYPIALSGRVPTKVSNMNGAIKAGDPLAPTTIPGVAAKAIHTGPIIGLALENFEGVTIDKIEVFVNPGWWTHEEAAVEGVVVESTAVTATSDTIRRGVGMISAGFKRVHIAFDSISAYPFVQVTPRGLIQGNWGTDGYSDTGFDIIMSQEQTFDAYFSWQVEPLQGTDRLNLSDGTTADMDPVTGLPYGFTASTTTEPIVENPETTSSTSVSVPTESVEPTSTPEIVPEEETASSTTS